MRALLLLLLLNQRALDVLNLGLSWSPWALLFRTYVFADWQFFGFLLVLILIDTVTGVLRSWHQRAVSSRGFSRIFLKIAVYLLLLVLAHVMISFTVRGEKNFFFQWFDTFIYCAMMAREALSVLENLASVTPELVPKKLLKRLALFQDDPEAALRASTSPAEEADTPPAPAPQPDTVISNQTTPTETVPLA